MTIRINGEEKEVDVPAEADGSTLQGVLGALGYSQTHLAVALNGAFVARSAYGETAVVAGDEVEVVAPMQGG